MSLLESTRPAVTAESPEWLALRTAVTAFRALQQKDGALAEGADAQLAARLLEEVRTHVRALAPAFPHDAEYLAALDEDLAAWSASGLAVPDFGASLAAFNPQRDRIDGLRHLVVFPMTTQNGSPDRLLEALLVDVIWPGFVDRLEREAYRTRSSSPSASSTSRAATTPTPPCCSPRRSR